MEQEANITRVPPYIPYKTFRTFIDDVRQHGIPLRLDSSSLSRISGSTRNQLISGLRFLGLVNENNELSPELETLKEAETPEEWKPRLASLLREAYAEIMEHDLTRISPGHLVEEFKKQYNAKDEVNRKCVTFFLHAAKDAGIELSPRVLKFTRSAPRRSPTPSKKKAEFEPKGKGEQNGGTSFSGNARERNRVDENPDVIRTPIALAPGRLAYIELPKDWTQRELKKLLKLLELSLGDAEETE
jgi:hypothetical protein